MNTLEYYKNKKGLSYAEIEMSIFEISGRRRCRTTIHKAVKFPWRTKWETFKTIAHIVNMPEEEARNQWLEAKRKFNENKYKA